MQTILLTGDGYTEQQVTALRNAEYAVIQHPVIDRRTLLDLIPDLNAYILGGDEHLDAEVLSRADGLRLISFVGTGYATFIDECAARARGIGITNTPGIMAPAVAEHTVGLLIGMARGLFAQNEAIKRQGSWQPTRELNSLSIGIVGMGATATLVAKILRASFGSTVRYANRTRKPHLEDALGLGFTDLDTLFSTSDIVILLAALAPETFELVNAHRVEIAKPGLIIINPGPAALVNPAALRSALLSGQIGAAAFDGYWVDPLPGAANDPFGLLSLPDKQFVVTPHAAAKTGTWERMVAWAVNNVLQSSGENTK